MLGMLGTLSTGISKIHTHNNEWYNGAGYPFVILQGKDIIFSDNIVWGNSATGGNVDGALIFGTACLNPRLSNN